MWLANTSDFNIQSTGSPIAPAVGMEQYERIATAHESFSALVHALDPRVLIAIACTAAGVTARESVEVRYRDPRIHIAGLSRRATTYTVDLVYSVEAADGLVHELWLFELQLSWSWLKVRRWALYELAFENEYDAGARLAVFAPAPGLRMRIRTKLLPRIKTAPILVEPAQIERIIDPQDARNRPELAVLGCLYHAHPPAPFDARVEVFKAGWLAIQSLADVTAQRYAVAVMSIIASDVVEQGIAELRESGELDEAAWDSISDSERGGHSFHRGREEGREEGRRELLRRALVDILELRGVVLTPTQHARIRACEVLATLEGWYAAAKTASEPVDFDALC